MRCWRDRDDEKSAGENEGFSLWVAVGCRLTHTAESSFRHVCECEREKRKREKEREGERAPWKQLQQYKMEFVSTLPELCTYSIHLSDTADFPPHTFILHLEWLCADYKNFEYKMKFPSCLHLLKILPVNIKDDAGVILYVSYCNKSVHQLCLQKSGLQLYVWIFKSMATKNSSHFVKPQEKWEL